MDREKSFWIIYYAAYSNDLITAHSACRKTCVCICSSVLDIYVYSGVLIGKIMSDDGIEIPFEEAGE